MQGNVFPSLKPLNARGFVDVRGLVHAHSVSSHDAGDDGFEMYNLHANLELDIGADVGLLGQLPRSFPVVFAVISRATRRSPTPNSSGSMQTRSTSTTERRVLLVGLIGLICLVFSACEPDVTRLSEPACHVNQFRLCPADCGRAVEQCIEPGPHWGPCSCAILDASYAVDAAVPDVPDIPDAPEAGDAARDAEAGDARDGDG